MKLILALFLLLSISQAAGAWTFHRLIVPAASSIDLSHLGVHTHADFLRFQTAQINIAEMRSDVGATRYRDVKITAHCRLPTDHADLPPGFQWLAHDIGSVPTYGSINGKPGWFLTGLGYSNGVSRFRYSVPTRFANWVAHQSAALRDRYKSDASYWLEIDWEQRK